MRTLALAALALAAAGCKEEPEAGALDAGLSSPEDASTPMPRIPHKYLALGSSSTAGSGASSPDTAYVALLTAHLRESNATLTLDNLASGGATIDSFLA